MSQYGGSAAALLTRFSYEGEFVELAIYDYVLHLIPRLAPVLKTIFHQCVISYTCSQSNSYGS